MSQDRELLEAMMKVFDENNKRLEKIENNLRLLVLKVSDELDEHVQSIEARLDTVIKFQVTIEKKLDLIHTFLQESTL